MITIRILITGSRDWPNDGSVEIALNMYLALSPVGEELVIVHGDCPTGADAYAKAWAIDNLDMNVTQEPHPADWKKFGKFAGPKRNREMVELGADECVAFIGPGSKGAAGCAALADEAGIPTYIFTADY